jgi:deoxycytidine triphosphate deaminase
MDTQTDLLPRVRTMKCLLNDSAIDAMSQKGDLIKEGYEPASLQPASYDLRMGKRVISITRGKPIDATNGEFEIHPGELVSVDSLEKVAFPLNIQGRICSKVSLLEKGFSSIATKVDPGYGHPDGWHLALVFKHLGHEPIKLRTGDPICSLEFERLEKSASKKYHGTNPKTFIQPAETADPIGKSQLDFTELKSEDLVRYYSHPVDDIVLALAQLQRDFQELKDRVPRRRSLWVTGVYVFAVYGFFCSLALYYWKTLDPLSFDNTTFLTILGLGIAIISAVLALYGIVVRKK